MKDEYQYVINTKVGGDMLTVRADSMNEVISMLIELKKAYIEHFGEPEREVRVHIDDEAPALDNCQQPQSHGMKYAAKGSKGMYCKQCWMDKKQKEGTWKAKK